MPAIKMWRGQSRRTTSSSNSFLMNICRSRDRNTFITVAVLACLIILILFSYAAFGENSQKHDGDSSLVSIFIVFRHGDRAPESFYPKDPYRDLKYWPEGVGQLTNKGKMEMYELGRKFRSQYSSFLPAKYSREDLLVRSSYADRCQMSALALLAGLYPPVGSQIWNNDLLWQPIPINSVARNDDNVIVIGKKCPNYSKLKSQVRIEMLKNFTTEQNELLDYLTVNTGMNITKVADVERLYFLLQIEADNGLKLPEWTKQVFPKKMLPIAQLMEASFSWNKKLKRFAAGEMLRHWHEYLIAATTDGIKTGKKLYLYSAHDVTVMTIMRSLGFDTMELPGFGSSIQVQLWHSPYSGHHIQILYDKSSSSSTPESLALPGCKSPCPLEKFLDIINPIITDNWTEECNE